MNSKGALLTHEVEIEIPFHDCDPMNVVWHGNYPRYLEWELGDGAILIEAADADETAGPLRLKDYADVDIDAGTSVARVESWSRSDRRAIVHWLPQIMARKARLTRGIGHDLVVEEGMLEGFELVEGALVQLERVGFARIESLPDDGPVELLFLHG